jgi:carbon monoxide dehydrogenase subunit G
MELNGTQKFAASPQAVWSALHDNDVLKSCIPAAESIAWQGDTAVTASGGVGPIKGTLTAQVVEQTPPSHLKFAVNRTNVNGTLTVDLAPDGAGTTLTYAGTVNAGGPVGAALAVAQGLIKGQVEQFFSRLETHVK